MYTVVSLLCIRLMHKQITMQRHGIVSTFWAGVNGDI
jgi:hypothetical protein